MGQIGFEKLEVGKMQAAQNVFGRVQWEEQYQVLEIGCDGETFAERLRGDKSRDIDRQLCRCSANSGVSCCTIYEVVEVVRRTETNASLGDNEHFPVS